MHINERELTLEHGSSPGRLIRATRYFGPGNDPEYRDQHYTNAIYSDDGGKTWPVKRLFEKNGFAYSSLAAGRTGTPSEGYIYLLYEDAGHPHSNGIIARFNLDWVTGGKHWQSFI